MISGITQHGFQYPLPSDMKEVCDKCKQAYYGDWGIVDCDYCVFDKTVKLCGYYANMVEGLTRGEYVISTHEYE